MSPILSSIRALLPDADLRAHMTARSEYRIPATGGIEPAAILTLEMIEQALVRGVVPVSELRVYGAYSLLDLERVGVAKEHLLRPLALRAVLVLVVVHQKADALADAAPRGHPDERQRRLDAQRVVVLVVQQDGLELVRAVDGVLPAVDVVLVDPTSAGGGSQGRGGADGEHAQPPCSPAT